MPRFILSKISEAPGCAVRNSHLFGWISEKFWVRWGCVIKGEGKEGPNRDVDLLWHIVGLGDRFCERNSG